MKHHKNFWEKLAETFGNLSDGMTFFGFFTFRRPHTPHQESQILSEENEIPQDRNASDTTS